MIDVRVDDTLDIVFIPGVDIDTVTGREADEQALRIAVIAFFEQVIGEIDRPTVLQKIELYARRVVESLDFVEEIDSLRVDFSPTDPDVARVEVVYDTGETFAFDANN